MPFAATYWLYFSQVKVSSKELWDHCPHRGKYRERLESDVHRNKRSVMKRPRIRLDGLTVCGLLSRHSIAPGEAVVRLHRDLVQSLWTQVAQLCAGHITRHRFIPLFLGKQ